MKQGQFEAQYEKDWQAFEYTVEKLEDANNSFVEELKQSEAAEFTRLYRRICHLHSLVLSRGYSSNLADKLSSLIARGHKQLYQRKHTSRYKFIRFFTVEFPVLIRRESHWFWLATLLLYGPGLLFFAATLIQPELVYTILDPGNVDKFESMYNPENRILGAARDSETNWRMFAFYISNNIGVSFRCFASGLMWCIGSIFFLVFNSLLFGAVAGHLTNVGYTETFFTFVVGHGSFELTAIAISGAAGMKLGYSILVPGNLTRIESLKRAASVAIKLVYGVFAMLVIAAFIEAFWSSNNLLEPWQKYLVGAALWAIVFAYLFLSGRGADGPE